MAPDIDMMAIVDSRRDAGAFKWDFTPKLIEAVETHPVGAQRVAQGAVAL